MGVVNRDTHHITRSVSGSGRLKAASIPTGHEPVEEQNSVAWLRELQYVSREDWAGSETAWNVSGHR